MGKWEYLSVRLKPKLEKESKVFKISFNDWDEEYFTEQLNEYACEGWELVSCVCARTNLSDDKSVDDKILGGSYAIFAFFKRNN
ncbi:MAG: DUF4177 domain-containing protein [Oscillospiraceae bacterium]|nr:DUF4177 domain-containing protein [Oscillospiraceae bacterium]